MSRFYPAVCWINVAQGFASCRLCGLEPFSKLKARFRHLARNSLGCSSQSLSNQIVKSKTLLISPTSRELRTLILLARPLPTTILAPDLFTAETLLGTYQGVTEQVKMSRTPGSFKPVFLPRGSSKPEWRNRENSEAKRQPKESNMSSDQIDLIVIGAGPPGVLAALRAAGLGALSDTELK